MTVIERKIGHPETVNIEKELLDLEIVTDVVITNITPVKDNKQLTEVSVTLLSESFQDDFEELLDKNEDFSPIWS